MSTKKTLQDKLNSAERYLTETHSAEWCATYGEPGYSDPARGIILANWNNVPKGLADWLERQGFELEWSDEWAICSNGKAWRTSPDCYTWQPSFILSADGEMITRDDEPSAVIDELAMTDEGQCGIVPSCVPSWITAEDLTSQGFTLYRGELESGFHPGQTDNPKTIGREAFKANALRVVFRKSEQSQFHVRFECWVELDSDEVGCMAQVPT